MIRRLVVSVLALAACTAPGATPPPPKVGALGGDVVARVGSVSIERDLVAKVAAAQQITPRAALDALVEDALAAEGARARGLDQRPAVKLDLDRARARFVADGIQARALGKGPPTDEEVAAMTARHWQAFDAPEGVKTVHVVVLKTKGITEQDSVGEAATIERAVHDATSDTDFEQRAASFAHARKDVRLEVLPPFAADGRLLEGNGAMDPAFVAAAFGLDTAHPQSGVVATSFGWHVIRLTARVPEKRVPLEERRRTFTDETVFLRGKAEKDAIVASYRKGTTVVIDPAAEALMAGAYAGFQ